VRVKDEGLLHVAVGRAGSGSGWQRLAENPDEFSQLEKVCAVRRRREEGGVRREANTSR
jgi:hypothetical protein